MGDMRVTFGSWRKVASAYDEAAEQAPSMLSRVVEATTDPGACGAASGVATVDGAVAVMLSVFGEVMKDTVAGSLRTGLVAEADALVETGRALEEMEQVSEDLARSVEVVL